MRDDSPQRAGRRLVLKAMATAAFLPVARVAGAVSPAPPRTFCLVHGSTQGVDGWRLLARSLESRGHRVLRPSLPYADAEASTADCADVVVDAIGNAKDAGDGSVCVVAHSISGLLLPLVARSPRVGRLVYMAAAVPQPGMSFREQFEATPDMYHAAWVESGRRIAEDPRVAIDFLYHDCAPEVARAALSQRIAFAAAKLWTEKFALTEHPKLRTDYVLCRQDRVFTTTWMRRVARERLRVTPAEIDSGHCPYLSRPATLADLLLA